MAPPPSTRQDGNVHVVETHAHDRTVALGRRLGRRLNHGLVLLLHGDLGSGKTAFAQGLARGLDVPDAFAITSPTYTLVNEYPAGCRFTTWISIDCQSQWIRMKSACRIFSKRTASSLSSGLGGCIPGIDPPRRIELFFSVTGETDRSIRIIAYGLDPTDLLRDIGV